MSSRLCRGLKCCLLVGTLLAPAIVNASVSSDDLKAVYLFRIANYIQWDSNEHKQNLVFCIQDNTSILGTLKQIVDQAESIAIDSVVSERCDIAYFDLEPDFTALSRHAVTVGSTEAFLEQGGAIALPIKKGAIRPQVNLDNLGTYTISSQLLRISEISGRRQ